MPYCTERFQLNVYLSRAATLPIPAAPSSSTILPHVYLFSSPSFADLPICVSIPSFNSHKPTLVLRNHVGQRAALEGTTIAATVTKATCIVQKRTAIKETVPEARNPCGIPSHEAPPTARAAGLHPLPQRPRTGLQIPAVAMLLLGPLSGKLLVGFRIPLPTRLPGHPVLHRGQPRAVREEEVRDRLVSVGSSGAGRLLCSEVVGGRWLGWRPGCVARGPWMSMVAAGTGFVVFSGVSGKGAGDFGR